MSERVAAEKTWLREGKGCGEAGECGHGAEKANAHYRGSLEPAGFWRGNGFRVVVA